MQNRDLKNNKFEFFGISIWFFVFAVLASLLFVFQPQIDLYISGIFYQEGEGFFWKKELLVQLLYRIPNIIVIAAVIGLFILIADLIKKKRYFNLKPLVLFYFSIVMIIGPDVIVHNVFKDNWGRARPAKVVQFGGEKQFTPAYIMSDQCNKNCSFVSGHSAGAFGLIALALLAKKRKKLAMTGALVIGSLVGLGRIIQGGHFFSDVLFSFVFVYITAKVLYYFTFEKHSFDFIDRRISK